MGDAETLLQDMRGRVAGIEDAVNRVILGQREAVRMVNLSLLTRGHVLLEGDVGVGKTTLLRAFARCIGGAYARVEGTIDLVPGDLVYHTWLDADGKPRVDPGPLLSAGEDLAIFFFNEINRARPQVHSILLRVMAERSVQAFNRQYDLPDLQVFADRNSLEKEETFELPAAARDRFLMELNIAIPGDREIQRELSVDPRFHDTDTLVESLPDGAISVTQLSVLAREIQRGVSVSTALQDYALDLCAATRDPAAFGIHLDGADSDGLVLAGVSPRGASMLMRVVRACAWLEGREYVVPEDIRRVLVPVVAHRINLQPIHEIQRQHIMPEFMAQLLQRIATP